MDDSAQKCPSITYCCVINCYNNSSTTDPRTSRPVKLHYFPDYVKDKDRKRSTIEQCEKHPWLQQEKLGGRCKRLNTERLRCFMARRKWQKAANAFRALGRMTSLQRLVGGGGSGSGSGLSSRQSSSSSLLSLHDEPGTPLFTAATAFLDGSSSPLTAAPATPSSAAAALSRPDSSVTAARLGEIDPAAVCGLTAGSARATAHTLTLTAFSPSQPSPAEHNESASANSSRPVPAGEGGRGVDVDAGDDEANSCGGRGQAKEGSGSDTIRRDLDGADRLRANSADVSQDSSSLLKGERCSRVPVSPAASPPSPRRWDAGGEDDLDSGSLLEAWRRKRGMKTGDSHLANQMGASHETRGVKDTLTSSYEATSKQSPAHSE